MTMIKVCVVGAAGKMGSTVCRQIVSCSNLRLTAVIERDDHPDLGKVFFDCKLDCNLVDGVTTADVVVDFALAPGVVERATLCAESDKPYVCGVTGLSNNEMEALRRLSTRIPVVYAANFSIGINVLYALVTNAVSMLGPEYDVEIIEIHHRSKRDAPSGTAKKLAEFLRVARNSEIPTERAVPIHSLRAGDVVGDHTVIFAGQGERLELTHRATSREAFGSGVIAAICFAFGVKPGFYSMSDVLAAERGTYKV